MDGHERIPDPDAFAAVLGQRRRERCADDDLELALERLRGRLLRARDHDDPRNWPLLEDIDDLWDRAGRNQQFSEQAARDPQLKARTVVLFAHETDELALDRARWRAGPLRVQARIGVHAASGHWCAELVFHYQRSVAAAHIARRADPQELLDAVNEVLGQYLAAEADTEEREYLTLAELRQAAL